MGKKNREEQIRDREEQIAEMIIAGKDMALKRKYKGDNILGITKYAYKGGAYLHWPKWKHLHPETKELWIDAVRDTIRRAERS